MKKKELRKYKDLSTSSSKSSFDSIQISIIMVESQGPVNVGLVCRVMKNYGFSNLILFNPQCEIDSDARKFSMHGLDILKSARIVKTDENDTLKSLDALFNEFDYVIGTSGKPTRFNNMKRITYYVDELDLEGLITPNTSIALVFGREDSGLVNEELNLCDFVIKIPVHDKYPALNLSHAVAITLFSVFKKTHTLKKGDVLSSTRSDRAQLYRSVEETLKKLEYTEEASENVLRALKNILGRSFSSLKEINLLISLFSSINKKK